MLLKVNKKRNHVILPSSSDDEEKETKTDNEEEIEEHEGNVDQSNPNSSDKCPSKFSLYQESVQSPKGDISYLQKFFLMYVGGRQPLHLRKIFVGLISLFHGDVLKPKEARLVKCGIQESMEDMKLDDCEEGSMETDGGLINCVLPPMDIVCAFNYSCCCLQKRTDLVLYFKHVIDTLSKKGGIFAMDVYGGTSSEHGLRLQRKVSEFHGDSVCRWSLPRLRTAWKKLDSNLSILDQEMPDTKDMKSTEGFGVGRDVKYEEVTSFKQQDAWNAYIVGVSK
ncbi:hypothetical protein MKW92_044997 [Papaver armeniacum]|nr:hypothetical protein MKW92_044997 [Papaver armeniacum]